MTLMPPSGPDPDVLALELTPRQWAVTGLLVAAIVAIVPFLPLRPSTAAIESDYRMPHSLNSRYELYQRMSRLQAQQFPILLIGDSVVWGQCAHREETLAHHLNALSGQPRFANAALCGLHPIALEALIEHHGAAIEGKTVLVQLDPLWLMGGDVAAKAVAPVDALANLPGLVPRLAAGFSGGLGDALTTEIGHLLRKSLLADWSERFAESRLDFLSWSLDHPYENPFKAISAVLPPGEHGRGLRFGPWTSNPNARVSSRWVVLDHDGQWPAFLRLVDLLEHRQNRVFVLVGPMNEHMMMPDMRREYQDLKEDLARRLRARGLAFFLCPLLESDHYGDLCHPLGVGYEEMARELLRARPDWFQESPKSY